MFNQKLFYKSHFPFFEREMAFSIGMQQQNREAFFSLTSRNEIVILNGEADDRSEPLDPERGVAKFKFN